MLCFMHHSTHNTLTDPLTAIMRGLGTRNGYSSHVQVTYGQGIIGDT